MNEPLWTPMPLIRVTAEFFAEKGIESARLDAELLLAHVLQSNRLQLYLDSDRPIISGELESFRALVKRRARREPLQLILGTVEILDHEFMVRPGVFIPRPETEVLIERCKEFDLGEGATIVEVGVGTGCIGLSLLAAYPNAGLIAYDVNPAAIALTADNAKALELASRVELRERSGLDAETLPACELLVSNPPYIPRGVIAALQPEVRDHDPLEALDGGEDGLDAVRVLVRSGIAAVKPGAWIALEHGDEQGESVQSILAAAGWIQLELIEDLSGRARVSVGRRPED